MTRVRTRVWDKHYFDVVETIHSTDKALHLTVKNDQDESQFVWLVRKYVKLLPVRDPETGNWIQQVGVPEWLAEDTGLLTPAAVNG